MTQRAIVCLTLVSALAAGGCGASRVRQTGFLSDYSNVEQLSSTRYEYEAPPATLARYDRFIIDPVEVRPYGDSKMTAADERRMAAYMHDAVRAALADRYDVVDTAGPDVARLRIALTDVRAATWWMNVHPGMKLTRAGAGEAAIEAEMIDAVTGEQLFAVIEAQKGNPVELDTFSKYDDARDVIDSWAAQLRERLDAVRDAR